MDYILKNKSEYGVLYEALFKSINEFLTSQDITIVFKETDIKIIEQILNNKDLLNNIILQKRIKRKIQYILSNSNKKKVLYFKKEISLNANKYFLLFIYISILIIHKKLNYQVNYNDEEEKYELYFKKIFLLLIELYKNKIIYFHSIYLFLAFYFELIRNCDILLKTNINNIILIINVIKKIIKITNVNMEEKEESIELLNKDIHNLLEKIFIMNNKNKIINIIFCKKILKYEKILDLFKICFDYYDNNILDFGNKNYIKSNLLK